MIPRLFGVYLFIGLAIVAYSICTAMEAALRAAQKNRLLQWHAEGRSSAAVALQIREAPEQYMMTLQIGMVCSSIVAAVLLSTLAPSQHWLDSVWPSSPLAPYLAYGTLVGQSVLLAYIILVCGQFIPRAIAQQHPEQLLCWFARPLLIITRACRILHALLTLSASALLWLLGQPRPMTFAPLATITEEDVTTMVREGAERGIFEAVEQELIAGVFEFTDTAAREIMVPRVHIQALEVTTPTEEVIRHLTEIGYSRVPVYEGDLDHILGILYFKDVFRALGEERPWQIRHLLHPALYVPEMVQISRLLRMLQQRRVNMAIVVDEHGGVAGLVTTEDLLEQLVGDIRDEDETETDALVVSLPDGALIVQGNAPLSALRERYALPLAESPDYHTLAGLLLARLEHVPKGGETVLEHDYTLTVVDMDGPRIARVKVQRCPPADIEPARQEPTPDRYDDVNP